MQTHYKKSMIAPLKFIASLFALPHNNQEHFNLGETIAEQQANNLWLDNYHKRQAKKEVEHQKFLEQLSIRSERRSQIFNEVRLSHQKKIDDNNAACEARLLAKQQKHEAYLVELNDREKQKERASNERHLKHLKKISDSVSQCEARLLAREKAQSNYG